MESGIKTYIYFRLKTFLSPHTAFPHVHIHELLEDPLHGTLSMPQLSISLSLLCHHLTQVLSACLMPCRDVGESRGRQWLALTQQLKPVRAEASGFLAFP